MKNVTILLAVLAVLAMAAPSYAGRGKWDGGGTDNLWQTGDNWETDLAPVAGDEAVIQKSATESAPATIDSTTTTGALTKLEVGYNTGSSTSIAYLTQTGGTANFQACKIGYYSNSSWMHAHGKYTVSGGTLTSGGLTIGGTDAGLYETGELAVVGAGSTITATSYTQRAGSTTSFDILGTGTGAGITEIQVNGDVDFGGDIVVTTSGTGHTGSYTLMSWGTGDSESGTPTVDFGTLSGWSWNSTSWATDNAVIVTVPEPATMVLLGIGGLGVLIRRKRRA